MTNTMRNRTKRDRPDRDWCAGESDTCTRMYDPRLGRPGFDGLCVKHHALKSTPARKAR